MVGGSCSAQQTLRQMIDKAFEDRSSASSNYVSTSGVTIQTIASKIPTLSMVILPRAVTTATDCRVVQEKVFYLPAFRDNTSAKHDRGPAWNQNIGIAALRPPKGGYAKLLKYTTTKDIVGKSVILLINQFMMCCISDSLLSKFGFGKPKESSRKFRENREGL
jgi:hypothetical protein